MKPELSEKIDEYIKNMPSLPTSVAKVLEVCNNPQTSPADLNHVISLDPVLVGRVLKLINSAYYGLSSHVTNLVRAIIMLGINTVKNLALSTAVMGNLAGKKDPLGLDMEGFWRHSLCVGVAAKLLAKKRGIDPKLAEEYFTAGLLHDIGKIPLNTVLSKEYMLTLHEADMERISLHKGEEKTLGLDHCAAGAMVVKAWKLEGAVGDAIIFHHSSEAYAGNSVDVLYSVIAANRFASLGDIGFAGDRYPDKIEKSVWDALGITQEAFAELEPMVNSEIEKAKIFLKI
ncbi:HDOD domain-containing protein [Leadbettera azotonutricia]|uniref:Metal dependent phosphohydrolase n=1 Tax=Leadbettera azotonutricia (strain ATCC BAA-888 / DSM 13862 / ZAS-9) TaxID=545695 RepID=F5YDB9_LEAAZ|nr:HDOD domain-containing protein [Leadbettera azotonutricia]AEF82685.1 metal dependent phosphohydrolase [Leadbettera azotonutricia ZAS-9]